MLWFTLVFLVLLKIPLVYLVCIVWWAVRSSPAPGEGYGHDEAPGEHGPDGSGGGSWWQARSTRRPSIARGPHGSPPRRPASVFARTRSRTRS